MIRWLLPLLASAALTASPAHAKGEDGESFAITAGSGSNLQVALALAAVRYTLPIERVAPAAQVRMRYGPFRIVSTDRVEMVGATDRSTPAQFAAMLREHPGIRRIDMVECPGTFDDIANLRLGRMIRAAGITMRVPAGGSVRSGAVDLFLAGRERVIENGAEFAVHSWKDVHGREATDYAADAQPNRAYLAYYQAMGMNPHTARAFYAFTNSAPHAGARWLEAGEMRVWAAFGVEAPHTVLAKAAPAARPRLVLPDEMPGIALLELRQLSWSGSAPLRQAVSLDFSGRS